MRCSRSAGLTLIEVVAAIAILGTILVGVVLAKARHTRQLALTQQKAAAARAADELIAGWWTSTRGVPIDASGDVTTDASLVWRTRVVDNEALDELGALVVRVELHRKPSMALSAIDAGDEALVAVELVLADLRQDLEQGERP